MICMIPWLRYFECTQCPLLTTYCAREDGICIYCLSNYLPVPTWAVFSYIS